MLELCLNTLLLSVAVYLTDPDEAGDYYKNLLVCLGIALANFVVCYGVFVTMEPVLGLIVTMLLMSGASCLVTGASIMWAFSFDMSQTIRATTIFIVPKLLLDLFHFT